MKIIQTCKYFFPYITGAGIYVQQLSKNLVKRGHEVTVYTPLRENTKECEIIDDIEIRRIPFSHLNYKLFNELMKQDYDILHAHAIWSHVPTSFFASKIKRKKFIVTPHGSWQFIERNIFYESYYRTLWRAITKNSSALIVLNNDEENSVKSWMPDKKVHRIPNAVDPYIFKPRSRDNFFENRGIKGDVVLFVGAMQKGKGIYVLLECIPCIIKDYPNTHFVLVGKEVENIHPLIKKYKISRNVHILGRISHRELLSCYSSADIFVAPSLYEPFGTVYLESMASELPTIGTSVGGTTEIIDDMVNGILVEPRDSEQLAEGIKLLLSDEKLRKKLGKNARKKIIEKYSWEKITDQIENLYKEVMED